MNKPFKYETSDIEWEYDLEQFDKWCKGQTGFPFSESSSASAFPLASPPTASSS